MEKPEGVSGNVDVVSAIREAHERNRPVVNARKARCQNFESNFMGKPTGAGGEAESVVEEGPTR
jgi:hypothetical protein